MSGDNNITDETPTEEPQLLPSVIQVQPGIYDPLKGDPEGKTYLRICATPEPSDYTPVDSLDTDKYNYAETTSRQPDTFDDSRIQVAPMKYVFDEQTVTNDHISGEQYQSNDISADIDITDETQKVEAQLVPSVPQVQPGIYDPLKGDPEGKTYLRLCASPEPSDYTPVDSLDTDAHDENPHIRSDPVEHFHVPSEPMTYMIIDAKVTYEHSSSENYTVENQSSSNIDSGNKGWTYMSKPSVPQTTHLYKPERFIPGQSSIKSKADNLVGVSKYPNTQDTLVGVSKYPNTKKKVLLSFGIFLGIVLLVGGAVAAALLTQDIPSLNQFDNSSTNGTTEVPSATKATQSTANTTTENPLAKPTPEPPVQDKWSSWSSWSHCDSTCGPGHRHRSRDCLQGNCVGPGIQSGSCIIRQCLRAADTYNKWGTWGPWTKCGATCGNSTQSRSRTCSTNTNKKDCIGEGVQQRACDLGVCPDCSISCTGFWDGDCLLCTCRGSVLAGRVITSEGGPIDNVKISPVDKPYVELTATGVNGGFVISDLCNGQQLLFSQPGFQSQTVVFRNESTFVVKMKKIVPLTIAKQPVSTARLTSSCIELQCEASGDPPPDYYEWFKDGMLIIEESSANYSNTNLSIGETGFYRCRANNDYGAVFSDEVQLNIQDSESEFCHNIPLQHTQGLPSGCLYNGQTYVDVGKCTLGACSKGGELSCDENNYECGIIRSDLLDIDCGSYRMALQTVTECGCVEKEDVYLELLGTVVDATDNNVIGDIIITYSDVSETSSANGEFVMTLTPGTSRITLSLTDPHRRYAQQVSSFNIGQNLVGSIEHTIVLNRRPAPFIFSPVDEILLELGLNDKQTGFADVIIPPHSIFNADGEPFAGDVAVTLNIFDPRDITSNSNPPGDFTAVGFDGQQELLESVGMMNLNIEDTNGNHLTLGGNVEILLPESILANIQDIASLKFWTLNSNGRWQYASDINTQPSGRRKKRYVYSTTVRGIEIDSVWCNFDKVKDQICHTKIRAFQTNRFNENEQLAHVDVQIVTLPSGSSDGTTLTRIRSVTDARNDENGYCIVHPCNSPRSTTTHDYHGYIIADYQGTKLTPALEDDFGPAMEYQIVQDKIYAKFDYHTSPSGPFYDWDNYWRNSQQCSEASLSDRHFRFYRSGENSCESTSYTRLQKSSISPSSGENVFAWYQTSPRKEYRTCFIKAVTSWDWAAKVEAISALGPNENVALPEGDVFGVRSECTENKAACLEVRSPFGITDGEYIYQGETSVHLRVVNEKPVSVYINDNLIDKLTTLDSSDTSSVHLHLIRDAYLPDTGVYCSDAYPTIQQAQQKARNACRRGTNMHSNITNGMITNTGWAVWFGAYNNCPGNYSSNAKCTDRWLQDFEYCNEDNFICQRCQNYWVDNQYSLSIPDHYNEHGSCDVKGKAPMYEGCCPACPGSDPMAWYGGYCVVNDSFVNSPYEYCMTDCDFCEDGQGLLCSTCPMYHTKPEYPNANGRCDTPNYELYGAGCCPRLPVCPGGTSSYMACGETECYFDQYCTKEGHCCHKCGGYELKPEFPNDAGQCSNPGHERRWEGCCPEMPKCPGEYHAYQSCVNNSDCHDSNEYCTSGGYCCSSCSSGDKPEAPDENNQCSNPNLINDWYGCCPPFETYRCPDGRYTYESCKTTECDFDQYCTDNGYCCNSCPLLYVTPEDPDEYGLCLDSNHVLLSQGCCPRIPGCPGKNMPHSFCNTTLDCDADYLFCTEDGVCCEGCYHYDHDRSIIPEKINSDGSCDSEGYEDLSAGCCPICSDGSYPYGECSNVSTCNKNTYWHENQYCTDTGLCCRLPRCLDGLTAVARCSIDSDCSLSHYCTSEGFCCNRPYCPYNDFFGYTPCLNDDHCNTLQEYCSLKGVCCSTTNLTCSNGYRSKQMCDGNSDSSCSLHEYCTPGGLCCPGN